MLMPSEVGLRWKIINPMQTLYTETYVSEKFSTYIYRAGIQYIRGVFKLRATFLVGPPETHYYPSRTLNQGGPLNVTHTCWFDTISNRTHN